MSSLKHEYPAGRFIPATPEAPPNTFVVGEQLLLAASEYVSACEHCWPDLALTPFAYIFDELTEVDPTRTEYVLCRSVCCPRCSHTISEKTLVFVATR
jgi:hypothetical protein